MKTLIAIGLLTFLVPNFTMAEGVITNSYITEIENNIDLLQELVNKGMATDRDKFMLQYYKKKLAETKNSANGESSRLVFTTGIANREPVNNIQEINHNQGTVYFFTELKNLEGKRITHRWSYNGNIVFSQSFNVGGSRWRVWTEKTISTYQGVITVDIVDEKGTVLQSARLIVR